MRLIPIARRGTSTATSAEALWTTGCCRCSRRSPASRVARGRGRALRHFLSSRLGAAARLPAQARRAAGAARARARGLADAPPESVWSPRAPPHADASRRLARLLPSLDIEIGLRRPTRGRHALRLRVAASHDSRWRRSPRLLPGQAGLRARRLVHGKPAMRSRNSSQGARTSRASTCRSPAARSLDRKPVPANGCGRGATAWCALSTATRG